MDEKEVKEILKKIDEKAEKDNEKSIDEVLRMYKKGVIPLEIAKDLLRPYMKDIRNMPSGLGCCY